MGTGIPTGFVWVLSWVQVREFVPIPIPVPMALIYPYLGNFFFWFQQPQCVQTKHAPTTHHQHHPSFHTKHQQTSLCCDERVIHVATPLPSLSTTTTTTHTCDHRWQLAISWPSRGLSRGREKEERRMERKRSGEREEEEEEEVKPSKPTNFPSPPNNESWQDSSHKSCQRWRWQQQQQQQQQQQCCCHLSHHSLITPLWPTHSWTMTAPPTPGQLYGHWQCMSHCLHDNVGGWQWWW